MLLDIIAIVILMGMMLLPVVNIIVGIVVGAGLGGPAGAMLGFAIAIAVTGAEKLLADLRQPALAAADIDLGEETAPAHEIRVPLRAMWRIRSLVPRLPRRVMSVTGAHIAPSAAQTLH